MSGSKCCCVLTAVDYPPGSGSGGGTAAGEGNPRKGWRRLPGGSKWCTLLQSLEPERTIVLKTEAPYEDPVVPSVTSVWRAADWYEREAHDLFGVVFDGHPDLSPLLLYDEFEGFPAARNFPSLNTVSFSCLRVGKERISWWNA